MSKHVNAWDYHDFYCINCGEKNMSLLRQSSRGKGKFHRKRLYCYHCKMDVNHIECRNPMEVAEFKELFESGAFKEESLESMNFIKEGVNL